MNKLLILYKTDVEKVYRDIHTNSIRQDSNSYFYEIHSLEKL